jgi:hypothetical protein
MTVPTQEAMKAARVLLPFVAMAHGPGPIATATIIDRETNLPALLDSHRELQEEFQHAIKQHGLEVCPRLEKVLAKAKDLQP